MCSSESTTDLQFVKGFDHKISGRSTKTWPNNKFIIVKRYKYNK